MSRKIALIGAGSAMFGLGTVGDILRSKTLVDSTIVLNDINPDALSFVKGIASDYVSKNDLPFKVEATTSLDDALRDADFCLISIEVGDRHALWEQDWKIPMQYGFRQVYGENGGPGGLFHALRITPAILNICERVMAICPDAYVFNLSNPMIRISHAVHTRFPDLRYVGVCHEVASLIEHLPIMLETPISNIAIKAGGFNHFSVLVEAHYKDSGRDAYPDIRERAPDYFAAAPAVFGYVGERKLFQEILKHFNYLPITTDSHFGEYIPWAASAVDHQGILEFYRSYRNAMQSNHDEALRRIAEGTPADEYWRVVPIMEGILTNSGHEELALNLPNDDLIPYLPADQIVEVPAFVDKDGIHGVKLDDYPAAFAALLMNQVAVNNMTTEAILSQSKAAALQALLVDPLTQDINAARDLLKTMLSLQQNYLGYLK